MLITGYLSNFGNYRVPFTYNYRLSFKCNGVEVQCPKCALSRTTRLEIFTLTVPEAYAYRHNGGTIEPSPSLKNLGTILL